MLKKDTIIIAASVLLFVILVALLVCEMQNPEGGVKLLEGLFGESASGYEPLTEAGLGLQQLATRSASMTRWRSSRTCSAADGAGELRWREITAGRGMWGSAAQRSGAGG